MQVKPVGQRILIKRDVAPTKIGSFILPEEITKRERLGIERGTVLAMGDQCYKDCEMKDVSITTGAVTVTQRDGKNWCEIGDRILYQRYSGMRIPDSNSQDGYHPDLVVVLDRDVVGIITEEGNQ